MLGHESCSLGDVGHELDLPKGPNAYGRVYRLGGSGACRTGRVQLLFQVIVPANIFAGTADFALPCSITEKESSVDTGLDLATWPWSVCEHQTVRELS